MSFDKKLRMLRLKHNLTQEYVANKMNVSRSTVAGYETKGRQPSHEKLTVLADIFHVSVDYLIDDKETVVLTPTNTASDLSKKEQRLLETYQTLSVESREDLLKYIELLRLRDKE